MRETLRRKTLLPRTMGYVGLVTYDDVCNMFPSPQLAGVRQVEQGNVPLTLGRHVHIQIVLRFISKYTSPVLHRFFTSTSPVLHQYFTSTSPVLEHLFFTSFKQVRNK